MSKWVDLVENDSSIHRIAVLAADVTKDNRVVISYNDYTDGVRPGYAELVMINGRYYKMFYKREWNYYSTKFRDHDSQLSNSIIESLPEKIDLYVDKKTSILENNSLDISTIQNINKKTTAYFLTAIVYANRGHDSYVKNGYSNLPPIFFTRRMYDEDNFVEIYKKKNIESDDINELLVRIDASLGIKNNISMMPENLKYEVSSGNKYYVNFSSCDNEELFCNIALSDELRVNINRGIKSGEFVDNLSSSLHRELPLEVVNNGEIIAYPSDLEVKHKRKL